MTVNDLDIDDIKTGLSDGSILLVDVREPHEFAAGHIPGSVSRPLSRFDPADLPNEPGKRIVLSCAAGVRFNDATIALAGVERTKRSPGEVTH